MSTLAWLSLGLFAAGEAAIFLAVGVASWPLVVAWALGALLVALAGRFIHGRLERSVLTGLLLPACVLLTFEGGLFFLPAVCALFVAQLKDGNDGRRVTLHHGR